MVPTRCPFSAGQLRSSASFVRLTGISVVTLDKMLNRLTGPWEKAQRRKAKSGRPRDVGGLEDHLLISKFYPRVLVCELPVRLGMMFVPVFLPGRDLIDEAVAVLDASIETL
jgi:hypothetical protein